MKTLYLLTLTLVAIIAASCGEPIIADDFFPLRVGDKFVYKLSPESNRAPWANPVKEEIEVKVTRKVDTLGKTYYVIENYFAVGTGFEGIIYARNDGHNVYFFAPDKEVLYYKFDPSDDKEYLVPEGIIPSGAWPGSTESHVIKKNDVGNNYITFLVKGSDFYSSYKHYSKFERGKGLKQVISQGDRGTVIYDLVKVYR